MAVIWETFLATLPGIGSYYLAAAVFLVAEQVLPAERGQPWRTHWFNARYTLVFLIVTPFVVMGPSLLAYRLVQAAGGSLVQWDLESWANSLNTLSWPVRYLVLPFVPMFIFDFFYYWHHRLQHEVPVLWEQHKLHHTDQALSCLTNLRHHWLEDGIRVFTITIPMTLLVAVSPVEGALLTAAIAHWALFIHANIRLRMGPLTPVVAGPQLHRIHHSRDPRHLNRNYAAFFPIWDILFRTYYRPARHEWPATGLASGENTHSMWQASVMPFRGWLRMLGSGKAPEPAFMDPRKRTGS